MNNWLPGIPWVWQMANAVGSFFVVAVLFAMIYKFLPDVVISWKDVWIGAAVTALLFTAGKYAIGIYLGQTATASAFGTAGSLVVLLFWVYYSALISFLGAEFTQDRKSTRLNSSHTVISYAVFCLKKKKKKKTTDTRQK